MKRPIEPGLLRVFRYFTGVAVVYFMLLWFYALFSTGWEQSIQFQFWGNFLVYLGLFLYLNISEVEHRLKQFFLPLGLVIATFSPVFTNFTYLMNPSQADISVIINRSWIWLPVLLVPLVLIAWQYRFSVVLIFIIFTNGLELLVLLVLFREKLTYQNLMLMSAPFIRAFAFGTVGYIVNILMETQRTQKLKLIQTNIRLNQYADTLEQLATSRERNRLATELHDTLAHTLSGLAINLEAIKTVVPPDQTEAQQMLDHSLVTTRLGLDETRRVLKALRAGPLEDLGLKGALQALVKNSSERLSIPIRFTCPDELPLFPPDVEQSVYRIVQEGLENIKRHANADQVDLRVKVTEKQLTLTLHDNGSGFTPEKATSADKFGLRGIKERASVVGGKLTIESKPGTGTTIRFVWERLNDKSAGL